MTVHDPICTDEGNLQSALYGSFLPIPSNSVFPTVDPSKSARHSLPGAVIVRNEQIVINKGRERVKLRVTNNGDRPIQVSRFNVLSRNAFHSYGGFGVGCYQCDVC